jgi:release factor glutamine methyltransferase
MSNSSTRHTPGEPGNTLGELLRWASDLLADEDGSGRLDAEVLIGHVTGQPRHEPYIRPERTLPTSQGQRIEELVRRRAEGQPVAYLTGECEFWSLPLHVTPATLIPRPETELVVESALAHLPAGESLYIADLGTGSGAIALALASERPDWRVVATERCTAALEVARDNARRLDLANVAFHAGDWFEPLAGQRFDLIVSNPPYVRTGDPHLERGDLRFEPRTALASGVDGLDAIRRITASARQYLVPGGRLILEHGFDQGAPARDLLMALGYGDITTLRDLAGHERVAVCAWKR